MYNILKKVLDIFLICAILVLVYPSVAKRVKILRIHSHIYEGRIQALQDDISKLELYIKDTCKEVR